MANAAPPTTPTTPLLLLRECPNGRAFEKCSSLLRRLLRHRHAWLFDAPVDVRGLGLRDYYTVIRSPMDLGTVRARLEKGRYRSPAAFAADVRLTFRNAMAYNCRGDGAYAMAEEISELFEARWAEIEDEFGDALGSPGSATAAEAEAEDSSCSDFMVLEGERNDEEVHEVIYIRDEEEENKADVQNFPSSSVVGGIYEIGSSSDPGISSRDPDCEIHLENGHHATNNVELICK